MPEKEKFRFLTNKSDAIEDDAKDDWLAGSNLDSPAEELVDMAIKIWRAGATWR